MQLQRREAAQAAAPFPATVPAASEDGRVREKMKQLKAMLDDGSITQADFDMKKKELLAAL